MTCCLLPSIENKCVILHCCQMCSKTIDFVASQICCGPKVRNLLLKLTAWLILYCVSVWMWGVRLVAGTHQPAGLANNAGCKGFQHKYKCVFVIVFCIMCYSFTENHCGIFVALYFFVCLFDQHICNSYFAVQTLIEALNNTELKKIWIISISNQ